MYRLMVYYLGTLLVVATYLGAIGALPYNPYFIIANTAFLIATCWVVNAFFAYVWEVPFNTESGLITALILALIITPSSPADHGVLLFWAAVLAMASKYILNWNGRHIFNPAALAVALTAFALNQSASWWAGGNIELLPFVLVGGFMVARKTHRTDLVASFILAAVASSLLNTAANADALWNTVVRTLEHTSVLFFAFVMITEPLTTPPRRWLRVMYGAIVGALFAPWVHLGAIFSTPELALLVGNVFSFAVSPRLKSLLVLREVRQLATDTYEYIFESAKHAFRPGQYAEFTLPADKSDTRGNRRYFTIASSPTEAGLRIGIKFYPEPSTFKTQMAALRPGDTVLAGSLAGDFTLPRSAKKKLVYIAGGIGVTPFRAMVKHQLDTQEHRDAILMYSNKTEPEIAYRDIFDTAARAQIGFRVIYTLTNPAPQAPWTGERGYIDEKMIRTYVPDFASRTFYISGPHSMVDAFKKTLHAMGVPRHRIKVDFFPGFA